MQELLDIFEIATPGLSKGALARSPNGKLASFLHVLCNLLQIKEPVAKKIIKKDDEACGRLVPIKLIGLRKTHPMGDASMIAAALVAIKSSRVANVIKILPARFFEIATGCLENPKSCLEKSASESLWEEFTNPFNDIHGSEIPAKKVADFSVKTISEDIMEKIKKKRKEDVKEFCECICEAVPQLIGVAEYNRYAGCGRKQATQLLKTPYVKLEKNGFNYYLADQNAYTGDMTDNEKKLWKEAFEVAWKKVKKFKKTIIGLSLRDSVAETLPPRAKILVARFYFIVNMWWKDIEIGKRRLWLTVSDARNSFGTYLDTGSHEMRSQMIKKIPTKEFFPGCLFGNNKIAEDFPRLYLKTMCPGFVQSSITYAYEKFLAAAIKRMITSPSIMEKTKSRVNVIEDAVSLATPELFARLADTRDLVETTLKNPDTYQKAAEQLGQLDEEQEKAINFSGNFQIICGGPGSGKTLVLIRLAQRYAEKYPPIKLQTDKVLPRIQIVAPTHKALQVIKTRFSKEKVPHDVVEFNTCARVAMPGSQCKAKVLIVDECGMVGTKLLYSVLLNVNPKIVCLFGDPNQLPPIDIGNPFGSLLQAATVPRVKLLRNYRQEGRGIHHVVKGVLEGEWRGGNADVAVNPKSILRMGYNELRRYMNPLPKMLVSPTNRVVDFLNNAIYTLNYKSPLRSGSRVLIVDPISPDNRLGTITTLYGHGPDSDALVFLDGTNAQEKFPQCMLRPLPYAIGQKLSLAKMHTGMRLRFIQKYGKGADIIQPNTLATCMETPGELRFPMERKPKCAQCARGVECDKHPDEIKIKIDGELCERPVRLDCLALGWAYTVHKSQGSEEDDVMFVVAERDESWCDRSLVYVALSRAKKSLRINGSDSQLRQMVARPPQKPCDLIALRVL